MEDVVQRLQAQVEQLTKQQAGLNQALQRAEQAYEQQGAILTATRNELSTALSAKAASSQVDESQVVDSRNIPKPPVFDGKRENWERWKYVFVAWASTVNVAYPGLFDKAEASVNPVEHDALSSHEVRLSRALLTILMGYAPDSVMSMAQLAPEGNGLEMWRRLVKTHEPAYKSKSWVWRKHLTNPSFPSELSKWSEAFYQWESEIREFERQFKKIIDEDEKLSVLVHVAPKELQQSIFMHADSLDSYNKVRTYIEKYLSARNLWKRPQGGQFGTVTGLKPKDEANGPAPMDIGAVKGKGKGTKGKGKGKFDKGDPGKGKGNQQQWSQAWQTQATPTWEQRYASSKGDKGKQKGKANEDGIGKGKTHKGDKGKGKGNNPHAGKQCHICKKYGHIAADCHWKVSEVREEPEPSPKADGDTRTVGSVRDYFDDPGADMIMTVRDTIAAIKPSENNEFAWFMVDSGACVTCATEGEFDAPIDESKKKTLYSVQGVALKVYGEQLPGIELDDGFRGTMRVTVTDASENVLAVDELLSKEWQRVVFGKAGSFLEYKNGKRYPLTKFGKRWWMRVRKRDVQTLRSQGADNRIAANADQGDAGMDEWRTEAPLVIRVHKHPRRNLFTPLDTGDCPVDPSKLENGRLTRMTFVGGAGGNDVLEDVWDNEGGAHRRLAYHWEGETCFKLKDDRNTGHMDDAQDAHAHDDVEHAHLMEHDSSECVHPMASPPTPSPEERSEHELHHATYAAWCPHCVAGQGRQRPHTKSHVDTHEHIVYADFMYFTSKGEELLVTEGEPPSDVDGNDVVTVLTAIDKDSRWPFAIAIPSKKVDDPNSYAVKSLENWLVNLGWKQFTLQTAQKPVILKLAKTLQKKIGNDKMQLRESPRYSSQSLADGETVNQQVAGRVRTWVSVLSEQYGVDIRNTHRLFPWIVRHVAWSMARLHVNSSRTTPFRIIKGHDYFGELLPFGERVQAKWPNMKDLANTQC